MSILKIFIFCVVLFVSQINAQLPGDAFVLSTNLIWKGRSELRKEHRRYLKMRKREKYLSRKLAGKTAQKFIKKNYEARPIKRKEKSNKAI